ncbi:hypothetical protein FRB99_008489 [Tulasnella sp. 403]|nr:hypothetical protein FRB99_008489 [Tulasnella sp. 403]
MLRSDSPTRPLLRSPNTEEPHASLRPAQPSWRRNFPFLLGSGIFVGVAVFLLLSLGNVEQASVDRGPPALVEETTLDLATSTTSCALSATVSDPLPTLGPSLHKNATEQAVGGDENSELDNLRKMVSRTKGYYGRDYSVWLGWNNMRYIIEASLLQARLLNRTLILPSFVYARACEKENEKCAAIATMVNRNDATGVNEWRNRPLAKQMAWRVPMEVMLDLPHLRQTHNVLLLREYLQLNGMDPNLEQSTGQWSNDYIGKKTGSDKRMTAAAIRNEDFDPHPVVRVDSLSRMAKSPVLNMTEVMQQPVYGILMHKLGNDLVLEWQEARVAMAPFMTNVQSDDELEELLAENGWSTLYTYAGEMGMEFQKSVVEPIRQVVPRSRLRGWVEDYDTIDVDTLVLRGETHLRRKPGNMLFTTTSERDEFSRTVLYHLRPVESVRYVAKKAARRMQEMVGGRMWMAGHMRRGDFVSEGWTEDGVKRHFYVLQNRIHMGRNVLVDIAASQELQPFDVPDVKPDTTQLTLAPPERTDRQVILSVPIPYPKLIISSFFRFFMATDERSPQSLAHFKTYGAVLIHDLLTPEELGEYKWFLLTDVLALVEQAVLGRSYYLYCHAMSSVAGGAVNLRALMGKDRRTMFIDD